MYMISEEKLRGMLHKAFFMGWGLCNVSGNPQQDEYDCCNDLIEDFKNNNNKQNVPTRNDKPSFAHCQPMSIDLQNR